jgi:hypothetical protein
MSSINIAKWIVGSILVWIGIMLWITLVFGNTTDRLFRPNFSRHDSQAYRPGCSRINGILFGGLLIVFGAILIIKGFSQP